MWRTWICTEGVRSQQLQEDVAYCRLVQGNLRDSGQREGRGLLGFLHLVQSEEEVQLGDRPQPLLLDRSVSRRQRSAIRPASNVHQ